MRIVQSRGRSMAPAAAASRSGLLLLALVVCCLFSHHGGTAMAFQVESAQSGTVANEEQQLLSVSSTHRRRLLSHRPPTLASVINETTYNLFFLHRNDAACPARNFFNYSALVEAAKAFPGFATSGSQANRKREVAAFLAQTSHETTGGWPTAPDGPYAWGYCFKEEIDQANDYCDATSTQWPCVAGQKYFGRGPIQLSWNFNYGPAGQALGFDGLANPGLLATDPVLSFKSALWFWMTPQPPKPSAHDVILGRYRATPADAAASRRPGYGLITNIINGGLECGPANNAGGVTNAFQLDRIGFYQRYSQILGVSTGGNLDCTNQAPYGA